MFLFDINIVLNTITFFFVLDEIPITYPYTKVSEISKFFYNLDKLGCNNMFLSSKGMDIIDRMIEVMERMQRSQQETMKIMQESQGIYKNIFTMVREEGNEGESLISDANEGSMVQYIDVQSYLEGKETSTTEKKEATSTKKCQNSSFKMLSDEALNEKFGDVFDDSWKTRREIEASNQAHEQYNGYSSQEITKFTNSLNNGNKFTSYILPKFNPYEKSQNKRYLGLVNSVGVTKNKPIDFMGVNSITLVLISGSYMLLDGMIFKLDFIFVWDDYKDKEGLDEYHVNCRNCYFKSSTDDSELVSCKKMGLHVDVDHSYSLEKYAYEFGNQGSFYNCKVNASCLNCSMEIVKTTSGKPFCYLLSGYSNSYMSGFDCKLNNMPLMFEVTRSLWVEVQWKSNVFALVWEDFYGDEVLFFILLYADEKGKWYLDALYSDLVVLGDVHSLYFTLEGWVPLSLGKNWELGNQEEYNQKPLPNNHNGTLLGSLWFGNMGAVTPLCLKQDIYIDVESATVICVMLQQNQVCGELSQQELSTSDDSYIDEVPMFLLLYDVFSSHY